MPNLTISQIEDKAQQLLHEHFGNELSLPVDVEALLAGLGGKIKVDDGHEMDPESLRIHADDSFTVYVPLNTSYRRDRFTIAHELGHLVLHHTNDSGKPAVFQRYGRSQQETEANAFAGALLMPERAFRKFWCERQDLALEAKLNAVVQQFQVSKSAANVRRQVLGYNE